MKFNIGFPHIHRRIDSFSHPGYLKLQIVMVPTQIPPVLLCMWPALQEAALSIATELWKRMQTLITLALELLEPTTGGNKTPTESTVLTIFYAVFYLLNFPAWILLCSTSDFYLWTLTFQMDALILMYSCSKLEKFLYCCDQDTTLQGQGF